MLHSLVACELVLIMRCSCTSVTPSGVCCASMYAQHTHTGRMGEDVFVTRCVGCSRSAQAWEKCDRFAWQAVLDPIDNTCLEVSAFQG